MAEEGGVLKVAAEAALVEGKTPDAPTAEEEDVAPVRIKKRKRPPLRVREVDAAEQNDAAGDNDGRADGDDTRAIISETRSLQRQRGWKGAAPGSDKPSLASTDDDAKRRKLDDASSAGAAAAAATPSAADQAMAAVVKSRAAPGVRTLGTSFDTSHGDQSKLISKQDSARKEEYVKSLMRKGDREDALPAGGGEKKAKAAVAPEDSVLLLDRSFLSSTHKSVTGLDVEDGMQELTLPMSYRVQAARAAEMAKQQEARSSPSPPPEARAGGGAAASPRSDATAAGTDNAAHYSYFSAMPNRQPTRWRESKKTQRVYSVENTFQGKGR